MFSEQEEKAFILVDNFLSELQSSIKGGFFSTYGKPSEYFLAKELFDKYTLIKYRNPSSRMSLADITQNGLKIINSGGIKKYLTATNQTTEEKENLELQQLRTNVQVLSNQHLDYLSDRKRFIRNEWALWISILLSIIAIIISLSSKN